MLSNPFTKILQEGVDRRRFLRRAGGLSAATMLSGIAVNALTATPARAAAALTDAEIFNFALNFEYLGSQYYLAALGTSLPASMTGTNPGMVIKAANTAVPFTDSPTGYFAQQLANDEIGHVAVIREVLGAAAIAQPEIDLQNSWTSLAIAAGLIVDGQTFNPFASEIDFLLGAYVLEDVCVTALTGAAHLISSPTNLAYAASILGTEGYQVGMIRSQLSAYGAGSVTDAISNLRSKLTSAINPAAGVNDNGTDYTNAAGGRNPYNFTNVDVNAQAFRRTPQEVLAIAYGGGTTGGGFFPSGVNGSITTS